jgi:hypothetical protein
MPCEYEGTPDFIANNKPPVAAIIAPEMIRARVTMK